MGKQSSRADDLEVIKRYSDMVYRMAFSLLKNKYDAEDIHQEVFVRYFRKRPEFENSQHERAWFLRVTVNLCRNFWKTVWKQRVVSLGEEDLERAAGRREEDSRNKGFPGNGSDPWKKDFPGNGSDPWKKGFPGNGSDPWKKDFPGNGSDPRKKDFSGNGSNPWKKGFSGDRSNPGGKDFPWEEETADEIVSVVKKLPRKYRIVIHLFYYEELSTEEIARVLKMKPSTVRTQLTRARGRLKKLLAEISGE